MTVLAYPLADTWGMHDGFGTGWGIVMLIGMFLFWGAIVLGIVWLIRAGAQGWSARGQRPVLLPALAYTPAGFAAGFAGTISIRPETATALIVDIASGIGSHGVRALAIANAHLDPAHLGALRAAVREGREAGLPPIVFPDLTRRPWGGRLSDEFRSGACHAGSADGDAVVVDRDRGADVCCPR